MIREVIFNFTVEEIYMVLLCKSKDKTGIINELQSYLEVSAPDMAEIIRRAIKKINRLTEAELQEVCCYPKKEN